MSDSIEHGTYAGWNAHRAHGVPLCDACRAAATRYQRERRRSHGTAKDLWWNETRRQAHQELAEMFPEQFREILENIRRDNPPPRTETK